MNSSRLIIALVAVLAVLALGGIGYKLAHRGAAGTGTTKPAPAQVAATPAAPPKPAGPSTTVRPGATDALKTGVLNPIFYVQAKMGTLQRGILAALNSRTLHLEELDKLDFSTAATTDPYNVFNPNGKVHFTPSGNAWIDQATIDRLTTKKGTPLLYNMHRIVTKEGTSEVLYAVLPNFAPAACGAAGGNKEMTSPASLSVENDPKTIIEDPAGMPILDNVCVHTPEGLIWFYKIKLRFKHAGETNWGSR